MLAASGAVPFHGMSRSSYADIIRTGRARLGWSQRAFARHAGITAGYVALLESGARVPGEELWSRLQRLFAADVARETSGVTSLSNLRTPVLADVMSAGRYMEFELPVPEESEWFDQVPFTTVVGPLGSGKTTFVGRWLSDVAQRSGRQVVWVQLSPTATATSVEREILFQTLPEGEPLPSIGPRGLGSLVNSLTHHLEGARRTPPILCFDDWDVRAGGGHDLVPELASRLERTPIVATTENARSGVGGATVRAVPRPTDADWAIWCDSWKVPESIRGKFLNRVNHNLLAASLIRSTVYFIAGEGSAQQVESTWREVVSGLPTQHELAWPQVVSECVSRLSDAATRVLQLAALSPEPVPREWLGEYANSVDASKLLEYRLARSVEWGGLQRLAVHPVLRMKFVGGEEVNYPWLADAQAEPPLVELLLNIGMFDEAARATSSLVEAWLPTSEVPASIVDWVDRLPNHVADQHPMVLFGLVRALALRGMAGDLAKAEQTVERLLALPLSDGQRWQTLLHGADVAIRSVNYETATRFVQAAEKMLDSSAGSFDPQSVQVLRARIHWEQSEFDQALAILGTGSDHARVENARHTSWVARANASLGDYAAAARSASRGMDLSRRARAPRAEAYSAVLLAEYELVRGNLTRARRFAERSTHIAESRGLSNLEAQALAVQAEIASAQGDPVEASRLLGAAVNAVTQRGDDAWTNAYLLVTQARLARLQPLQPVWSQLWSLAQSLENEAVFLERRAERHPVVGALRIEAAYCWIATGYSHEARRLLQLVRKGPADWRTSWEARLLDIVSLPEGTREERQRGVAKLVEEARAAGAPYLAVQCAYLASTYRIIAGDDSIAAFYAAWVADVADSRGWPVLASRARAIAPAMIIESQRGERVTQNDGSTTLVAPRRRQHSAREDLEAPLPDPFAEE
jgi:transcriptional regulator with XRE-family HTH domain